MLSLAAVDPHTFLTFLAPVRVIHTSEARTSGAFTVTRTSTNTCNSVTIKNFVKYVKFLA